MKFLREITKIAEWGLKGDTLKVAAYVKQLTEKLIAEGDEQAATHLRELMDQTMATMETSAVIPSQGRIPVDSESRLALADEEVLGPNDVTLVLDSQTAKTIEEFIQFVEKADQLEAHGVGIAPSLITYGPPGSGKTQLARHIAARLGLPLVTARADTLISSFLGSTSKNLRQLFDHVAHRHCILFLDELDAFAKLRDDQQELGELKRVVVSLLQNIDARDRHTIFLAATNHEHLLDPAIWRRFTYRVPLSLPAESERRRLMSHFLGSHAGDLDNAFISAVTDRLSGADIRSVAEGAIREAVIGGRTTVDQHGLLSRIIRSRLGTEISIEDPTPEQIKAVHDLAPAQMSGKVMAELFKTSASTISRKLKKGGSQ